MKQTPLIGKPALWLGIGCGALATLVASAQTVLYSDNFDVDSSANWTIVGSDGGTANDYSAFFATNYQATTYTRQGVTANIPAAPNGGGAGLKLFVNKLDATAAVAAISAFPNTVAFSNDYALKVDMFLGYNGPVGGGTGSTEYGSFGINMTNTTVCAIDQSAVTTGEGVWFAATGEGGAAGDYRSVVGASQSTGFGGGFLDRDEDGTVETEVFFSADPPTVPLVLMFPTNSVGETAGALGKQWVQVEIRQRTNELGDITTWLVNNYVIARHTNSGSGNSGRVMLGNIDSFGSIASPAEDNYVIYDNLRVVDLQGVADLPEVSITATDPTATESPAGDDGTFTVTRTGSTANALTVTYVVRGSAVAGTDYTALPGSVTFLPGASETNITVVPLNDTTGELTEKVIVSLNTAAGYEVFDSWAAVDLVDDGLDVPLITVATARIAAYEGNTNSYGLFRVIASNPSANDVNVSYTLSGTAVNGTHYESLPLTATFSGGNTTNELAILPIDNADSVSNRTVIVTLVPGAGYLLGGTTNGTVVIFNDDLPAATGTLYSDNFDTDSSAAWNINASTNNCDAAFAYDYSAIGIPAAPRSPGGSTLGLRLRANSPVLGLATTTAQFPGITVSPTGQSFTGDYRMRMDAWLNFPGPFPGGGAGSTQIGTFGITRGTVVQWSGFSTSSPDAVFFGMTGDGGSGNDWRIYTNIVRVANSVPGVYAAGTAGAGNNTESYYSVFGQLMAPPGQSGIYLSQSGVTAGGTAGMVWHDVVITKLGSTVIWAVDGVKIGTVNTARFGINLSTNIFLGLADVNGTQTSVALDDLLNAIYDNLVVESLPAASRPVITNIAISGGNVQLDFTNSVTDFADLFTVQTASTVDGVYTYTPATVTELAPGSFRATLPYPATGSQFYRIRR